MVELNYKQSESGNFNDCTDKILKKLNVENVGDDDDKENVH